MNSLSTTSPGKVPELTREDKNILAVHRDGVKFRDLDGAALLNSAQVVLAKIAIITGWVIPGNPRDANDAQNKILVALIDQLSKKLKEGYFDLNQNEIEYAFRNFGLTVEDWGKIVNLNLIDKVLAPYMEKLRSAVNKTEPKELPSSIGDIRDEDWLKDQARKVQAREVSYRFVPLGLYDYIVNSGKINLTPGAKWRALTKAVELQLDWLKIRERDDPKEYAHKRAAWEEMMKPEIGFSGPEREELIQASKRVLLFEFLKTYAVQPGPNT